MRAAEPFIEQVKSRFELVRQDVQRPRGASALVCLLQSHRAGARLFEHAAAKAGPALGDAAVKRARDDAGGDVSVGSLLRAAVRDVGSVTPVADFLELVADQSEDQLVKAARQLHRRIEDLMDLYVGGATDPVLEMVLVLRRACVTDEPRLFNDSRVCAAWPPCRSLPQ